MMAKTNCRKRRTRLRIRTGKGVELPEETVEVGFLLKRENAIVVGQSRDCEERMLKKMIGMV